MALHRTHHQLALRFALPLSAWCSAACEPVLDIGTWLGAPSATTPTFPAPLPTRPSDDPPGIPTSDAGFPRFDSGVVTRDSGSLPLDAGRFDAGEDAGRFDGGQIDAGRACTFPGDVDHVAPAEPREWTTPIEVPWRTGFENGFCAFATESGYCYAEPEASYTVVTDPARSGAAAAFSVATSDTVVGAQARCVRRGLLPAEAYYGAWYFISERPQVTGNWNLFHFLGGNGAARKGLWDVSIRSAPNGQLFLYIRDFFAAAVYEPEGAPPLPVGEWVHVQFYLRRAADMTGELALYQNGQRLFQLTDVVTDDTEQGAWYVGNLADDLAPADFTLFLDDVTIAESL